MRQPWLRKVLFISGLVTAFGIGMGVVIEKNALDNEQNQASMLLYYTPSGVTIKWLPNTVKKYTSEINTQAKRYDVDANLLAILMTLESGGYVKADSGFAKGLLQITPTTAADIAKKHLLKPVQTYDLFDPKTSIEFGASYMAWLRTNYCNSKVIKDAAECVETIAAGYNGGPGAIIELQSGRGLKNDETLIYSRNAYNMWREKAAANSPTYERWYQAGGQRLVESATRES